MSISPFEAWTMISAAGFVFLGIIGCIALPEVIITEASIFATDRKRRISIPDAIIFGAIIVVYCALTAVGYALMTSAS